MATGERQYRIFRKVEPFAGASASPAAPTTWEDLGPVEASSMNAAIAAHAQKVGKDALGETFAAVPERHWNPATLKPKEPTLPFTVEHEKPPQRRGSGE